MRDRIFAIFGITEEEMGVPEQQPITDLATNIVQHVMDLTTITATALGRKLRVPAKDVKSWASGATGVPDEVQKALQEFIDSAARPARDTPRVERPVLPSALVHADCRKYLKDIPDESVDLILSDIPYGIGLDGWDVLHNNSNSAYMGTSEAQAKAGKGVRRMRAK